MRFLAGILVLFSSSALGYAQPLDQWVMLTQQAQSLANQGRFSDAMPIAKQALAVAKSRFTDRSLQYALSLNGVGFIEMSTGDFASAQPDLEQASTLVQAASGPNSVQAITPLANLANLYVQQAQRQTMNPTQMQLNIAKAEDACRRVLVIAEFNFKGTDMNLASPIQALAQVLSMEQKFKEAILLEKRLFTIEQANLPADSQQIIRTRADLATTILGSGDSVTALEQLKALLPDAKRVMGVSDPFVGFIQDMINQLSSTSKASVDARRPMTCVA